MCTTYSLYLIYLVNAFIFSPLFPVESPGIRLFQAYTIPFDSDSIHISTTEYTDKVSGEIVYQVKSKNYPLYYYSNIKTGVCADDKCRPLDMVLYWNITGRYLGFALPEEEFLSKYEHKPFSEAEYERLHMLLADSLLPLGNTSFVELIQTSANQTDENAKVDGVSGATSQQVLDYVVEGAAYTTHALWNIIYGSSQDLIKNLTLGNLSNELLITILQSPDVGDRFWALNHLKRIDQRDSLLQNEVLELINDENYSLGVAALQTIDSTDLCSEAVQISLLEKFYQSNTSLKNLIIDKLKEAPALCEQVVSKSSDNLSTLDGKLLVSILDLYQVYQIKDKAAMRQVANLLEDENRYISQKAFKFLNEIETQDSLIQKQLRGYLSETKNQD